MDQMGRVPLPPQEEVFLAPPEMFAGPKPHSLHVPPETPVQLMEDDLPVHEPEQDDR